MQNLVYDVWLNSKESLAGDKAKLLLDIYGSAENIYNADKAELSKHEFLTANTVRALMNKQLWRAEKDVETAINLGVSLIPLKSPSYPARLKTIFAPPPLLYAKGNLSLLHDPLAFCIVGTRHATAYGISSALQLSQALSLCGMTIVSGCAEGIDTAAHRGALKSGGKTIGVVGCGIDVNYPSSNKTVRESITEQGVIISEFPFKTPPYSKNFPKRNRLLSGLSLGVAVIEADRKSGSLITASYALEQEKDIFALPGNVSSRQSHGTNKLIQQGAYLITCPEDIVFQYVSRYPELFKRETVEPVPPSPPETVKTEEKKLLTLNLSEDEHELVKLLSSTPTHIDSIIEKSGKSASSVAALLTVLQIKGVVKESTGKFYSLL